MSLQNNKQYPLDKNSFVNVSPSFQADAEVDHNDKRNQQALSDNSSEKYKTTIQSMPFADQSDNQPLKSDNNNVQSQSQPLNGNSDCNDGLRPLPGNKNCNLKPSIYRMNNSFAPVENVNDPDINKGQIYQNLDVLLNSYAAKKENPSCKIDQKKSEITVNGIPNLKEGINPPSDEIGLALDNKNKYEQDPKAFVKTDQKKSEEDLAHNLKLKDATIDDSGKNLHSILSSANPNQIYGKSRTNNFGNTSVSKNFKPFQKDRLDTSFEICKSQIVRQKSLPNSIHRVQTIHQSCYYQAKNTTPLVQTTTVPGINKDFSKSNFLTIDDHTRQILITNINKGPKAGQKKSIDNQITISNDSKINKDSGRSDISKNNNKAEGSLINDNQNNSLNWQVNIRLDNTRLPSYNPKNYNDGLEKGNQNLFDPNADNILSNAPMEKIDENARLNESCQASLPIPTGMKNSLMENSGCVNKMVYPRSIGIETESKQNLKADQNTKLNKNLLNKTESKSNSHGEESIRTSPDRSEKLSAPQNSSLKTNILLETQNNIWEPSLVQTVPSDERKNLNDLINSTEIISNTEKAIDEGLASIVNMRAMSDNSFRQNEFQIPNQALDHNRDLDINSKTDNEILHEESLPFDANKIIHFVKMIETVENGYFVEQYQIAEDELVRLSNIISQSQNNQPIQYNNANKIDINFSELLRFKAKFTGIFGRLTHIIKCLSENKFIKESEIGSWEKHFQINGSGLYLILLSQKTDDLRFLIILYANDDDYNNMNNKKGIIQLLRYMTQLCNTNILSVEKSDVDRISFESQAQTKRRTRYKAQTIKTEEDKCEIVSEFILNPKVAFDGLIGNGSQVGFYSKRYFDKKTNLRRSQYEWKNFDGYNKYFSKFCVNTDNLKLNISNEQAGYFIWKNFNTDYSNINTAVELELNKYMQENEKNIENEINYKFDIRKCFYVIQILKHFCSAEYKCLSKMKLTDNFEPDFAKTINEASKINDELSEQDWQLLEKNRWKILDHIMLNTEIHALQEFMNQEIESKDFKLNEYLPAEKKFSKGDLYARILETINSDSNSRSSFFWKWNLNTLVRKIDEIKNKPDFSMKYCEAIQVDTKILFHELFCNLNKIISLHSFKSVTRDEIKKSKLYSLRENHCLNILKNNLRKNYGTINAYMTSINIEWSPIRNKICIAYEQEEITDDFYEYDIYQFKLAKEDSERSAKDENFLLMPKEEKKVTVKLPGGFEAVDFYFIKNNKLALVANRETGSELKFCDLFKPKEKIITYPFGNKILESDYNETENRIAFLTRTETDRSIVLYFISDNFSIRNEATVDFECRFGINDVRKMKFGKLNEIFLLDDQGMIHKINYKTNTRKKINRKGGDVLDMVFIANTNCLLLITKTTLIPYIVDSKTFLPELPLNMELHNLNFIVAKFNSQTQLMFNQVNHIDIKLLNCVLSTENYTLVKCSPDVKNKHHVDKVLSVFDYLEFMLDKYSIYNPLQKFEKQNISQKLIVYLIDPSNTSNSSKEKIEKKLEEIQSSIKKPYIQEMGLASNARILSSRTDNIELLINSYCLKNLSEWITELICLVPTQISRCDNNKYIVLEKGMPMKFDDSNTLYDVKNQINFGLYECIFKNWEKNIKVITSMGKQSTGKSYTLNHLSGSTFSIAGGRCTDGCWLSIRITDDCLYVLMDFEGLGSFERSEQEDMLLSIHNASLSNLTIFKADTHISRDTDKMFNRFNQGANMLKGDNNIFQGLFCIMIKDISKNEIQNVTDEFEQKMNRIIEREQKKDFISTMYKSGYEILPFPPLSTNDYYVEMNELANYIQDEIKASYNNGRDFMNLLKLIMAKMSIEDFTSLNQQEVNERMHLLNQFYTNAFTFGKLSDSSLATTDSALKSFDSTSIAIEESISVTLSLQGRSMIELSYQDFEINLNNGSSDYINILNTHYQKSSANHIEWSEFLKLFMKEAIKKRIERVLQWVDLNLEKWNKAPDFKETITNFKNLIACKAKEVEIINQMCKDICQLCNASCSLLINHGEKHTCEYQDHSCKESCTYCLDQKVNNKCSLPFGHYEKHACFDQPHMCGSVCKYEICENKCIEKIGHEGEHKCSIKQHKCLKSCSLKECQNRCQISADKEHVIHKCVNDQCMKKCEVQNCKMKCASNNHFHGEGELSGTFKIENDIEESSDFFIKENESINCDFHCCGNDHLCEETCSESGYCQVMTERKVLEEEFRGERDTFRYGKQFECIGSKENCCKIIPKFKKYHEGNHLHTLDKSFIHSCTDRCPTCNNICEKGFGHDGKHHTTHGNMEKYYFISNQRDFDIGDHKYVVGEPSMAEMCHMFCNKLGRGHIHVVPCNQTKENCNNNEKDKRRHETCKYGPNTQVTKDEIKHDAYWDLINFDDPCQELDKKTFSKCPAYCGHEDHKIEDKKQYCRLDLWHDKVASLNQINKTTGMVCSDGHYFECSHNLTKGYHFVLCLDNSGSMTGQPWNDLKIAVTDFCSSRKDSLKDRLTIILFDHNSRITCENIQFKEFEIAKHLNFNGGGTNFDLAIIKAKEVYKRYTANSLIPILIFMSDGECDNGKDEIAQLKNELGPKELQSFFIGFKASNIFAKIFGSNKGNAKLEEFARLANGKYSTRVGQIQLKESFMEISSKLGTTISVLKSHK